MEVVAGHWRTGERVRVEVFAGKVRSVTADDGRPAAREAAVIAPGMFDLHIAGAVGVDFSDPRLTPEDALRAVQACRNRGVTALLPTLPTAALEDLERSLVNLREAREQSEQVRRAVPGFHLEGPWVSLEDGPRGEHPPEHVRRPDWGDFRRLQEAAGGLIRLVTLSPEHPESIDFIARLAAAKVVPAIGHTAAGPARVREAAAAGARFSTHLGNGTHAMLPRHDNYLWEQLAADGMVAGLVCDGHHLPASLVKCAVRAKGPGQAALTSNASPLAGMPPGRYAFRGRQYDVGYDGRTVLAGTPYLAGSGSLLDAGLTHLMAAAGVTLADAVRMAAEVPRELLGLPAPRLEVGHRAELMLLDRAADKSWRVAGAV